MTRTHSVVRLFAVFALILALLAASRGAAVQAAGIAVNTTTDELNSDGDCSLREAIEAANTDLAVDACAAGSGADTITVPAGTYGLTDGALQPDTDMTINGAGAASTIVDGGALDGVFEVLQVEGDIVVTITGMTIQNGSVGCGPK